MCRITANGAHTAASVMGARSSLPAVSVHAAEADKSDHRQ